MANAEASSNGVPPSHDEAEEDMANNNDPNNNAFDMDTDEVTENVGTRENTVGAETSDRDNIDDEVSNIMSLLPDSNKEDVIKRLNDQLFNPDRQQVGMIVTFLMV